jgi:hypothetical protein
LRAGFVGEECALVPPSKQQIPGAIMRASE